MENPQEAPANTWRRRLALAFAAGVGFAFTMALIGAVALYVTTRPPKPRTWNTVAVSAKPTDLYITTNKDAVYADYRYALENHTNTDYQLPGKDTIYKRLPKNKGLENDGTCEWGGGTFVPAGQRVSVTVRVKHDYTSSFSFADSDDNKKLTDYMARRIAEMDGFVVLDPAARYQINFPKPVGPMP